MLSLLLLAERNEAAKLRTEARLERSNCRSSTRPGSRIEPSAVLPVERERAVQKMCAPVVFRARAISIPRPEEQPVMRIVLSVSLPAFC
jgi:hypothetical protein